MSGQNLKDIDNGQGHTTFKTPILPATLTGDDRLPRFGSLSSCKIDDAREARLWELEAIRLLESIASAQVPLAFSATSQFPNEIGRLGFEKLAAVSDRLLCAAAVCELEDQVMLVRFNSYGRLGSPFAMTKSFQALEERLRFQAASEAPVSDAESMDYYLLVDYITVTLARLLASGVAQEKMTYWHCIALTSLAKFSAKLKVLSHNLPLYGREVIRQPMIQETVYQLRGSSMDFVDPSLRFQDAQVTNYLSDMSEVSEWLFHIVWEVVSDLATRTTRGWALDEFDIAAMVCGTGLRLHLTIIYQNRRGYFSGSPSGISVGLCHWAFGILADTAEAIRQKRSEETQSDFMLAPGPVGSRTTLELGLRSMAELVSIMVPLSFMGPTAAAAVFRLHGAASASATVQRIHNASWGFAAYASLHNKSSTRPGEEGSGPTATSPSYSCPLSNAMTTWKTTKQTAQQRQTEGWAIEEMAISVGCLRYTLGVMSACALLVAGGLLAGFLVGSRIDGVDPFNLAMFSWIIAGFSLLVAKSVRVAEWPWRDFLKGRVTCRSVQELASVTGLDEQVIITHLLSLESRTPLRTRGPYNVMFNKAGEDGFSIDVSPRVDTLAASGIIIVEVLAARGPVLVCLDIRPGPGDDNLRFDTLVHSQFEERTMLVCVDPPRQNDSELKPLSFLWLRIRWEKVIGVFNNPERTVI
ncbi:hypothetical protein B0H63DRAFT_542267 [Podospora didyma]|uniref:Uncharacterized protein n=1 Tax=Podospora didyma TaxID=330526 RepID=A0AAE0U1V8_9PEZI|nr:hypothetical protein B0H63DRAFT_542267 [Podospora didyma]